MTMSELDALLQQHFPSAPPHRAQQGRAGVTLHRVESNTLQHRRAGRNDLSRYAGLEMNVTQIAVWHSYVPKVTCPICGKLFEPSYGVKHVYCSTACKQKAYRQRKKAGKRQ